MALQIKGKDRTGNDGRRQLSGLILLFQMEIILLIRKKENLIRTLTMAKQMPFSQLADALFHNKLKLGAIIRLDKNDYFPLTWSPRFTAVIHPLQT